MIKMTILVKRPSETSGDLRCVHGWAIHYSTWRDLRQSNVTQDYAITNSHDPILRSNYTDNLKHSIPPIIDQLSIKLANFYVPLKEGRALKKASEIWEQQTSRLLLDTILGRFSSTIVDRSGKLLQDTLTSRCFAKIGDRRGSKISTQAYFEASINVTTTFHGWRPRE